MWRYGMISVLLAMPAAAQEWTADQIAQMRAADIVILGEIHDNPAHHLWQAQSISQIDPKAVVFELLTPEMAGLVNLSEDRAAEDLGEVIGWEDAGWPDYAIYQPVFAALGNAIAVGAAEPREAVRAAFSQGAAAVFGAGAERFGLDDALPAAEFEARRQLQFDAHCEAMPMDMMGGMIEAQRLRDAQFSATALEALETYGAPIAVITGNGHARRDWGMPHLIGQAAPDVTVFSVGFLEAPAAPDDPRFDASFASAPLVSRGDPCAAFKN